jgi:hypothetical protein
MDYLAGGPMQKNTQHNRLMYAAYKMDQETKHLSPANYNVSPAEYNIPPTEYNILPAKYTYESKREYNAALRCTMLAVDSPL